MSLARDVTTVGSGTLVSRLLGYLRDAGIAALLGSGPVSDALFAVFQVVNFFRRLLAEGALNNAFVPLWLASRDGDGGIESANRFTRRTLLTMFVIAGIVALVVAAISQVIVTLVAPGFDGLRRDLAGILIIVVSPYVVLAGLVAVIAAALNAEKRVAAVTISTVMFNVVMLAALALAMLQADALASAAVLAGAIVVAALTQFLITGLVWLFSGRRFAIARRHTAAAQGELFRRALPGLVAAGIPQLKLIATAAIASSSAAAVSWLYYANRLYELPLGVASIAIAAAIVPRIAASVADIEALSETQSRAFEITLGLALPAAAGFALLADPIAAALFERGAFTSADTAAVAAALVAICAGLPAHVLEKVLDAIAFAHGNTRMPLLAGLTGLAAAVGGGLLLFPHYGHVGVAAAIALSAWIGAGAMTAALARRGWLSLDGAARRRLPRIVAATLVMAIVVGVLLTLTRLYVPALHGATLGRMTIVAALVAAGVGVYLVTLQALGVARIRDLKAAIGRKS